MDDFTNKELGETDVNDLTNRLYNALGFVFFLNRTQVNLLEEYPRSPRSTVLDNMITFGALKLCFLPPPPQEGGRGTSVMCAAKGLKP